jgi:ABC-type amino acid transport substrate-binding protein
MTAHNHVVCFLAALIALVWPHQAVSRPLDNVTKSGSLRIAVYQDFEPFSYMENGELTGIDVDIGKALAKSLNLKPTFMNLQADEDIDDDLRNAVWKGHYLGGGVADVMLHVPVDPQVKQRNEFVVIFGRYFTESIGVAADPSKVKNVVTMAPFLDEKIGAEIDTLASFYLGSAFGGQLRDNMVSYKSIASAAEGLKNREVAGLMAIKSQADWAAKVAGAPIEVVQPSMPGLMVRSWDIGAAVKHDSRDLGYAIGDELTKLRKSGEMEKIFAKYGVKHSAKFLD